VCRSILMPRLKTYSKLLHAERRLPRSCPRARGLAGPRHGWLRRGAPGKGHVDRATAT
jgi:hypothetical protein